MKKFIVVVFLVIPFLIQAQSLRFSQVLLVTNIVQTVPASHVWKVESYWKANTTSTDYFNSTTCTSTSYQSPIIINSNTYYILRNVATGSSYTTYLAANDFPLWLPAGTTLKTVCYCDFLSVIDFEIVP